MVTAITYHEWVLLLVVLMLLLIESRIATHAATHAATHYTLIVMGKSESGVPVSWGRVGSILPGETKREFLDVDWRLVEGTHFVLASDRDTMIEAVMIGTSYLCIGSDPQLRLGLLPAVSPGQRLSFQIRRFEVTS